MVMVLISVPFRSLSAPCYGTKMPDKQQVVMGFQVHSIMKRYLESEYGKVRSLQYFYLLSYGLNEWFSIDLKGGVGNIKQRPSTSSELDYPSSFAGGYGFIQGEIV